MEDVVVEKTTSIWKKKQGDLTVGDQLKVVGMTGVIGIVVPVAIGAVTYGAVTLYDKYQTRRENKKNNKAEVIEPVSA
jgi:hypothetical protein